MIIGGFADPDCRGPLLRNNGGLKCAFPGCAECYKSLTWHRNFAMVNVAVTEEM